MFFFEFSKKKTLIVFKILCFPEQKYEIKTYLPVFLIFLKRKHFSKIVNRDSWFLITIQNIFYVNNDESKIKDEYILSKNNYGMF